MPRMGKDMQESSQETSSPAGTGGGGKAALRVPEVRDVDLVARCLGGDVEAFGQLVRRHQDRVFALVYRMCPHRPDAEDLAQETFLTALRRLEQFRGDGSFGGWVTRIAANLTLSHRRRQGRVNWQPLCGQADGRSGHASPAAPIPRDERSERSQAVLLAIEALPADARLVLILRDLEGMSYDEIARLLELKAGTVRTRLHRARNQLRQQLGKVGLV